MRTIEAGAAQPEARDKILEAALLLFAEKGFDGATTRAIAARAGVPLGLLRYYYGSKLKLWQASVDRSMAEIHSDLDVSLGTGDELAGVRTAIRSHARYVARHPEFVRLMQDEGKRRGPRMRWLVDRHVKPLFARVVPLIERLQSTGRLPADVAPMHFVYCLIGAINTIFHQAEECRRVTGVDPGDEAVIEAHARAVEFLFLGPPPNA